MIRFPGAPPRRMNQPLALRALRDRVVVCHTDCTSTPQFLRRRPARQPPARAGNRFFFLFFLSSRDQGTDEAQIPPRPPSIRAFLRSE